MDKKKNLPKLERIPLNIPEPAIVAAEGRGLPYFEIRFLLDLAAAFGETAYSDMLVNSPSQEKNVEQ